MTISNRPLGYRVGICTYCGRVTESNLWDVCDRCETMTLFSDLYKDDHGVRPRGIYTFAEAKDYIARRLAAQNANN
jgi:hypothetical protein